MKGLRKRIIACGRRCTAIASLPNGEVEWDAPEKRQFQPFRRRFHSAFTERVRNLAAVRAGVAGHVFHQPDDRNAGLVEQLARPRRVDQHGAGGSGALGLRPAGAVTTIDFHTACT